MVRLKRRYILCEVVFPDHDKVLLTRNQVYHAVQNALILAYGDYGAAVHLKSLSVRSLNPVTGILIIRAQREGHKMLTTALPLIKRILKYNAFFKSLHVGGTIRSCNKFAVRYHRRQLTKLLRTTTDPEERKQIQSMLLARGKVSEEADSDEDQLDSDGPTG